MDETRQDGGDGGVRVDGGVGPRVNYLRYCKVDDDFGEAAGWVVQVATLIRRIAS